MTCEHKEIVMSNTTGKPLEQGGNEIDFVIRCHNCDLELFRIGERGRNIINLSSHLSEKEKISGYIGTMEALTEEMKFISNRMDALKNKMLEEHL